METANVYGDLTKTGLGWGFVGLRVEGLVGGKKMKTENREEMEQDRTAGVVTVYTHPTKDMDR